MLFHWTFVLMCLALTLDRTLVESYHLLLNPDMDTSHVSSDHKQAPGSYGFPDFARGFTASKQNHLENATPARESSSDERDVVKRQEEDVALDTKPDEKKRKPGCRNYYWKSWTAC